MLVITTFAGKRMLGMFLALICIIGSLSSACHWLLSRQPQPIRVGINSPNLALAEAILSGFAGEVQIVPLSAGAAERLARGELDYYISGQGVQGFQQQTAGHVVAAAVTSYFNPREDIGLQELESLVTRAPKQVLISEELALADFFWSGQGSFLPTAEVVAAVAADDALLGLIPLQRRAPALRVLAVDGIDPREAEVLGSYYPLKCRLRVQKRPSSWRERLQEVLGEGQEDSLVSYLRSVANPYWDPWHAQSKFAAAERR